MSPPPQGGVVVPLSTRSETKNRDRPYAGVGQKSAASELMGSPMFQGAPILSRSATQMSLPPRPPGRLDANRRLSPSADSMGQPSAMGARALTSLTGTAVPNELAPPWDSACIEIRGVAVASRRVQK